MCFIFGVFNSHNPWISRTPNSQTRKLKHRGVNDKPHVLKKVKSRDFHSGLFDVTFILPYTAFTFIETNLTNSGYLVQEVAVQRKIQ